MEPASAPLTPASAPPTRARRGSVLASPKHSRLWPACAAVLHIASLPNKGGWVGAADCSPPFIVYAR